MYLHMYSFMHFCMHKFMFAYLTIHTYVHAYIPAYTLTFVHVYIQTHAHVHVHTHTYTHTHTHTHTQFVQNAYLLNALHVPHFPHAGIMLRYEYIAITFCMNVLLAYFNAACIDACGSHNIMFYCSILNCIMYFNAVHGKSWNEK